MSAAKTISPDFPFASKYLTVHGARMHYLEAGTRDPPALLLHGVPTHAYLWRKVIPLVSSTARTVAPDLIGFGRSDQPTNIDYDLPTQLRFLEAAIDGLGLKDLVIVGMDLGLILGLSYAMAHESNVKGLVMFEGFIEEVAQGIADMPFSGRAMLGLCRSRAVAKMMICGGSAVEQMIAGGTVRTLSDFEMDAYRKPLTSPAIKEKVWLDGIGPHTIRRSSKHPGDVTDAIARYSAKLRLSKLPKLLLYAEPGAAVTQKTLRNVGARIPNLEMQFIGKGKHFLPEDQPENIGHAIEEFCRNLGRAKS